MRIDPQLKTGSDAHDPSPLAIRRVCIIRTYPSLARGDTNRVFVPCVRPVFVPKHVIWTLDLDNVYPYPGVTLDNVYGSWRFRRLRFFLG